MQLRNVLIVVSDMDRAIGFYDLGWSLIEVGAPM